MSETRKMDNHDVEVDMAALKECGDSPEKFYRLVCMIAENVDVHGDQVWTTT